MHTVYALQLYTTNCDTLCILTPFGEPPVALLSDWTPSSSFQPSHIQQRALATHDPLAVSPLFFPWKTFDKAWPLLTGKSPQQLWFWRLFLPSHLVITIWLKSLESLLLSFFLLLTDQIRTKCPFVVYPDEEIISVIHLTCQWSQCYAWFAYIYRNAEWTLYASCGNWD